MIGAGAGPFAVMGYVIAHQDFDRASSKWVVRLNPTLLSTILGENESVINDSVTYLCSVDQKSGSSDECGRRLVPFPPGSMEYWVVNGEKYQAMREYEERKVQNREAQTRHREKLEAMTPEQLQVYIAAKEAGKKKVRKTKGWVARAGEIQGRTEGVAAALEAPAPNHFGPGNDGGELTKQ